MVEWKDLKNIKEIPYPTIEDILEVKDMKVEEYKNQPYFATTKQLEQYCNKALYLFEKRFLEWAAIKMQDKTFINNVRARSYTLSDLLKELYGRPWDPKLDNKYRHLYLKVLRYYSSSIKRYSWDKEKQKKSNRRKYVLSIKRIKECVPYSLRLRFEMFNEQNIEVTNLNMRLPKDTLKTGHSRNKVTEQRIRRRSEEGRRRYEQWINQKNREQSQ